jgi:hypothetical protein
MFPNIAINRISQDNTFDSRNNAESNSSYTLNSCIKNYFSQYYFDDKIEECEIKDFIEDLFSAQVPTDPEID